MSSIIKRRKGDNSKSEDKVKKVFFNEFYVRTLAIETKLTFNTFPRVRRDDCVRFDELFSILVKGVDFWNAIRYNYHRRRGALSGERASNLNDPYGTALSCGKVRL